MARRRFLGENIKYEIKPLSKIANTAGFFTYGEFYQMSENYLLNQTMTILFLSETKNYKRINENIKTKDDLLTLNALSHLINVTSSELIKLNNDLETKIKHATV